MQLCFPRFVPHPSILQCPPSPPCPVIHQPLFAHFFAELRGQVESREAIEETCRALDAMGVPKEVGVWAMIETPMGILRAEDICKAGQDRLDTVVMGTSDLTKDLRGKHVRGRQPLLYSLEHVLLCARAYGVVALDGVCLDLDNPDELEAQLTQAYNMGFDGKTLIHPKQVEPANRIFAPTSSLVETSKVGCTDIYEGIYD